METVVRGKKRIAPNLELEKLPHYRAIKRAIFHHLRRHEVEINGFRMQLDPVDSLEISLFGRYEPFETSLVESEVRPGMTVVDAGANIGYYSLLFGRLTGPTGRVYAFEPAPQNRKILEANIAGNGLCNITVIGRAASDRAERCTFFLSNENLGDHRMFAADEAREELEIQSVRIDEEIEAPVHFIKLDIQGSEHRALIGMERLLAKSPSVTLFTEFWPKGIRASGGDATEFLALLRAHGFEIFHIDEYANRLEKADDAHLLSELTLENGRHTNLLCRRKSSATARQNSS
jgi:FkbM family methyltransferase